MMKCIIVDDEPLATQLIESYVERTDHLVLQQSFNDPIRAIQYLSEADVDLVFLDIQMPELTGIQFLKIANKKAGFILTTAYEDYALKAFDFEVLDYLLKPIIYDRFLESIRKAKQRLGPLEPKESFETTIHEDFIFVKSEYKIQKLDFDEILYIEGMGDYINIQTTSQKILSLEGMAKIMNRLPDSKFIRVHKSYIIPFSKITFIEKSRIKIGEKYIPLSASYQKAFYDRIQQK